MRSTVINPSVKLSVHEHIFGTDRPIFEKYIVQIPYGHGSVLLWQRCDMLCTSGFMDDVTFGHTGPYGKIWRLNPEANTRIPPAAL